MAPKRGNSSPASETLAQKTPMRTGFNTSQKGSGTLCSAATKELFQRKQEGRVCEEEEFCNSLGEEGGLGAGAAPLSSTSSPLVDGQHLDRPVSEASKSEAAEEAPMRAANVKEEQEEDQEEEQEEERDGALEETQEEERDGVEENGCPRGTKANKATRAAKRGKKERRHYEGNDCLKGRERRHPQPRLHPQLRLWM